MLRVDTASPVPIWNQIEEGVRRAVATGALATGAPVPSVRELARELRVNPATVSKAYQRLAEQGVLEVRRGDGTYVSDAPPALSTAGRRRLLADAAVGYASLATSLGLGVDDAREELQKAWSAIERRRGKGKR